MSNDRKELICVQRFDGKGDNSWGLKTLEKNCFERMKNYKEKVGDGSFTFQRDEYLKLKAELEDKDFYFGAAVYFRYSRSICLDAARFCNRVFVQHRFGSIGTLKTKGHGGLAGF